MKRPSEMSDDELIHAEFMRRFSLWNIPVDRLDMTLAKMTNEKRQQHYLELKEILEKDAFHRELDDWLRRVSFVLSLGSHDGHKLTDAEQEGLRIVMLEIKNFEDTLSARSTLLTPTRPLRDRSKKL